MARKARVMAACLAVAVVAAACGNAKVQTSRGGSGAPGVTSTSITVGSIANITGILSSDFAPIVDGVKAYFSMVNAQGGVNGRKLVLGYQKDDQGNPTTDVSIAQQLVEQDHVFAIVGVGTPFFGSAKYLAQQGVPTFGYQVSADWEDGPSLFGTYGSFLDYSKGVMSDAYVAAQLHAASIGVVAYGVPQSAAACQAAVQGFGSFGLPVSFQDLSFGYGADPTGDVLQMKSHHVDALFTCLDVSGNVAFARALSQNGLSIHQVWLNGYDRSTLQTYGSLLDGVILEVQHVPFEAVDQFPGVYPGMAQYIQEMQKYQPKATYEEVALEGWIDAATFVAGLRAAGKDLTQAKLVAAVNNLTNFTAGGLMPPLDWSTSHGDTGKGPWCNAYVQAQGGKFVPEFVQNGSSVFVCFTTNSYTPVAALPGTPGG